MNGVHREAVPCLCVLITHVVMNPTALDEIVLLLCEKVLACLHSDGNSYLFLNVIICFHQLFDALFFQYTEQDNRDVPRCLLTLGLLSKFHRFDHFEVAEIDELRLKLNVPSGTFDFVF
jgi:hypothetical protein